MSNSNIAIYSYTPGSFVVGWDWKNFGYGEITVKIDQNLTQGNTIEVWNDNLTKEEVREILLAYVDHIIDHGIFKEFRQD
jgi:hypothetical protein